MLSFNTNLIAAFRNNAVKPIFLLDLEYNAGGSSYTLHLSDRDVLVGTTQYYGLISNFGAYHQSADIMDFTTSIGSTTVTIINSPGSLKDSRFSDQFATNNFVNRIWRLYLWADGLASTYVQQIAMGIITSDLEFNEVSGHCTLKLVDYSSKWSKDLPQTLITAAAYPNAPENNIGKPIPMFYGDADVDPDAPSGGSGAIGVQFDRYITKGKVPALITDKFNATAAAIYIYPDTAILKQLRVKNVFLGSQGHYAACDNANVDVADNPQIAFSGSTWRLYIRLLAHSDTGGMTNYDHLINEVFTDYGQLSVPALTTVNFFLNIPKLANLGTITTINIIATYSIPDHAPSELRYNGVHSNYSTNQMETLDITSTFTSANKSAWTLNNEPIEVEVEAGGGVTQDIKFNEVALEIEYSPSESFIIKTGKSQIIGFRTIGVGRAGAIPIRSIGRKWYALENIEMLFISGKGRMFGAWIDTINATARATFTGAPDPGYAVNDLIENPVYQVEDICRRELGMDGSTTGIEIDTGSFDYAGSSASAKGIFTSFGGSTPLFMFSQNQIINSLGLISEIGNQCNTWFFFSGDGRIKAKTRLPLGEYGASYITPDKTIDYNNISILKIRKTDIGSIINDMTILYKKDYQSGNLLKSYHNADTISQDQNVTGINQIIKYEMEAELLKDDYTTASRLAESKLDFYAYQKPIIEFESFDFRYFDVEICDVIQFTNWDANRKVFGATPASGDYYSIFDITKTTKKISIKCFEVS